ncbi:MULTISPECIES: hypothetical protein [unclassified Gilliamella]|uniref:hypothetical protein n=1 Tax=unclassified Gilliamella TaxID=2685620 RepID=UPI001309988E|nr:MULTISPECIES: hypothetical protein [unclassified Gilliamella]MWP50400.1 hypothetical protein [Gilliamella sp. Lep-s35]MWP70121.1 hypothetical protein [Gilliamella sp. Lep-s5]MWP78354.1 hypothetical protein [Gilliamella sp. Lep-s21]
MKINELKLKLNDLKILEDRYSLNGELLPDRIILCINYNKYEVFYLDERGNKNEFKVFYSEEEACDYLFKLFKEQKLDQKKYGINI